MSTILFIFYLLLFPWLLIRNPFVKRAELGTGFILSVFLMKVLAGLAYGYIHAHAPGHVGLTDTWKFFYQGAEETTLMKADPSILFKDLFPQAVHGGFGRLFNTSNSFWNDVKHELMVKLAAVLNLFSGTDYYVNIVWYNFLVFLGPVALYRAIIPFVANRSLAKTIAFLVPSALFWGSGFHKEGIVFAALSLIFYVLVRSYREEKNGVIHYVALVVSFMVLLFLRNNLLLPLLPALAGYMAAKRSHSRAGLVFASALAVCIALFFLSPHLGADLPAAVSKRQHEFIRLGGRTAVDVPELRPGIGGFIQNLPSAMDVGFLRPHPMEGGLSYVPFTLEIFIVLAFGIYVMLKRKKHIPHLPLALFAIAFALLSMLMIGYTVPNIGAVVRYKSIALPFLVSGLAMILQGRSSN